MGQPDGVAYVGIRDERSAHLVPAFNQVMALAQLATAISIADLNALMAEYDRMDTLMPILDPMAYLRQMRNIPQHREVTEAVLNLRRVIARVMEREGQVGS